jgi:hypothetical protein
MPTSATTSIDILGIAHVLQAMRVRVPEHQRPFKWTKNEVQELLDDVEAALSDGSPEYFLGTIVVIAEPDGGPARVLDGQQRLATVTLLLALVAESLATRGEEKRAEGIRNEYLARFDITAAEHLPQLRLNDEDDPYFGDLVKASTLAPADGAPDSHRRLFEATQLIKAWLETKTGDRADATPWLLRLTSYLDSAVRIILVTVSDDANAYRIFETLNDRGLDLSIADLLKNYLLGRSGEEGWRPVLDLWRTANAYLHAYGGEELFPTFLRHYWSSRFEVVRERELYREIKRHIISPGDALDFARELRDNSYYYAAIISDDHEYWSGQSPSVRGRIRTLNVLGLQQYRPMLLPALWALPQKEIDEILRLLIGWNVRLLIVGGLGSGPMEKAYSGLGRAIRNGELTSVKNMAQSARKFVPADDEFQAAFQTARVSKVPLARYYLRELENQARGQGEPELVPAEQLTLEHVLPERPEGNWPDFADDEVESYSRRLGNMVLLAQKPNSALRSAAFTVKRDTFLSSQLRLTHEVGEEPEWGKQQIVDRQKRLAALAVKVWPLK